MSKLITPFDLISVDNFNFLHKKIFIGKNDQFSDYSDENEVLDDFVCTAENYISNYEETPKFENIFSYKKDQEETISQILIGNDNDKEDESSKKIREMLDFIGENNDESNSLNFENNSLKNKNNKINNNSIILGNNVVEANNSNEICGNILDNNIVNKKLKKESISGKELEIDYMKTFQLFNKGTNNPYINGIINSINIKKKQSRQLFKIYNIEHKDSDKLLGKKRRDKIKKRYEISDDIRKKLKSRFHKIFTQKINDNLKAVNSDKKFYLLPQIFISNITIKQNKEAMNMKIKDLFGKNFVEDYKEYKLNNLKANTEKYLKNLHTLYYLEKNIDIQEKCKFNIIGEMKYFEILEEFFYSKEFEDTVIEESQKKSLDYVKDYVEIARTYVKFFMYSNSG